eukprot:5655067-Pyramimonas_sp.AAC.1
MWSKHAHVTPSSSYLYLASVHSLLPSWGLDAASDARAFDQFCMFDGFCASGEARHPSQETLFRWCRRWRQGRKAAKAMA